MVEDPKYEAPRRGLFQLSLVTGMTLGPILMINLTHYKLGVWILGGCMLFLTIFVIFGVKPEKMSKFILDKNMDIGLFNVIFRKVSSKNAKKLKNSIFSFFEFFHSTDLLVLHIG